MISRSRPYCFPRKETDLVAKEIKKVISKKSREEKGEESASFSLNPPELLINEITERSANKLRRLINRRLTRGDQILLLTIDSVGGDVYSALSLIDLIEHIKKNKLATVITFCSGKAFSAGALLLSAGEIRLATPHSTIMLHEVSAGIPFCNVRDLKIEAEEVNRLNALLMGILSKNMSLSASQMKELFTSSRDLYLTPTQALKLHLIDRIGYPEIKVTSSIELS